jgi:hypothetical protein
MAIETYSFYARHYSEIGRLLQFEKQVQATFPIELAQLIVEKLKDAFAVELGGLPGQDWICEYQYHDQWHEVYLLHPDFYHNDRGPYFTIGDLGKTTEQHVSTGKISQLVTCALAYEGSKGAKFKKLLQGLKRNPKIKKHGYNLPDDEWNILSDEVGDLLHISTFQKRQKKHDELVTRVQSLINICMPAMKLAGLLRSTE